MGFMLFIGGRRFYMAYNETPMKGPIMSRLKNSVNDAMKTMRNRADSQKSYNDILAARHKRVRIQNIATVAACVAGVALGAAATAWSIHDASKPMTFEDEN